MTIEVEEGKPPEWMIALENKQKRHHKLAHEIGAGAPCLNCNDGCVGLDLHFWRKICRNCKCKKEEHNVKEENSFEHFEILFGDNLKNSDRVKKLSVDLKFKLKNIPAKNTPHDRESELTMPVKCENNDLLFDWIPADVPVNLASEYLQQLPLEKLPITGSAGALFRRQQLQKQIPLYDFKIDNCQDLTEEEAVAFTEYVDNLKTHAVGKGQITKVPSIQDTPATDNHLKPPVISANLNSSPKPFRSFVGTGPSAAADSSLPPPTSDLLFPASVDLKTPSAFVPKTTTASSSSYFSRPENTTTTTINNNNNNNNVPYTTENFACDKYMESSKPIAGLAAQFSGKLNINERNSVVLPKLRPSATSSAANINDNDSQNNNWCSEQADPTEKGGKLTPSEIIRKLNAQPDKSTSPLPPRRSTTLSPTPSKNVDGKFVKIANPAEGFLALSSEVPIAPLLSNTLNGLPRKGKTTRDLSPMPANGVMPEVACNASCHQCKRDVLPGQVVVVAERADAEVIWHPQCFVCVCCQELLVDLVYFFHRGDVYCGRHYAEVLKIPRCFACDELIFLKEYTVAENQTFHVRHFCCFECDEPLAGKQYVPRDNQPICLPCYEAKYGKECHYCEKLIKAGDSRVGWQELSWHATEACFKCIQCFKSLLGGRFVVRDENPLCSKECVSRFDERRTR